MSRHICFRCEGRHAEFCASSRFTILVWDDALGVLARHGVENPFRSLPDDAWASGADVHAWLEAVAGRLGGAPGMPVLYQIWRVRDGGDTWQSDAGYFRWGGVTYMADCTYDSLVVHALTDAEWQARQADVPYVPPGLDDVHPPIVPARGTARDGTPIHPLSAADFERLFADTPLHLEHGPFPEFLRAELDEARAAARHAADAGERVVLYTY